MTEQGSGAMTHDPLCPSYTDHLGRSLHQSTEQPCHYCDLIAKVRADEQELMTEDCDCSDCVPPPLPPSVGVPEKRWFK
jgi:hypothetical protein